MRKRNQVCYRRSITMWGRTALICLDQDGIPIVDNLGQGFRDHAHSLDYDSLIGTAQDFVKNEHERFKTTKTNSSRSATHTFVSVFELGPDMGTREFFHPSLVPFA